MIKILFDQIWYFDIKVVRRSTGRGFWKDPSKDVHDNIYDGPEFF